MADMTQAQARQAAIAAGHDAAEVDAFIAKQGGARTSAQRITSAFGVAGSTGTNDLTAFHAQKATAAGADASGKGTYLSGMTAGTPGGGSGGGGGGGTPGGGTVPDDPSTDSSAPMSGLAGAFSQPDTSSQSQPQEDGGSGLRQNLGNRMYPVMSAALAGLQRAY